MKVEQKIEEQKILFKMEKFTSVPAKIQAEELENREIDYKRSDLIEQHRKRTED